MYVTGRILIPKSALDINGKGGKTTLLIAITNVNAKHNRKKNNQYEENRDIRETGHDDHYSI